MKEIFDFVAKFAGALPIPTGAAVYMPRLPFSENELLPHRVMRRLLNKEAGWTQ